MMAAERILTMSRKPTAVSLAIQSYRRASSAPEFIKYVKVLWPKIQNRRVRPRRFASQAEFAPSRPLCSQVVVDLEHSEHSVGADVGDVSVTLVEHHAFQRHFAVLDDDPD